MKAEEFKFISACLPKGRTVFRYRQGAYAAFLLSKIFAQPTKVKEVKTSGYGSLLNKPLIKEILKKHGGGILDQKSFILPKSGEDTFFLLSVGCWGEDIPRHIAQTSRSGCNLVLRLVFSNQHDAEFKKCFSMDAREHFEWDSHPITRDRITLAWSRLDIDLEKGEVLIEELQNDWMRNFDEFESDLVDHHRYGDGSQRGLIGKTIESDMKRTIYYSRQILRKYRGLWSEALLSATLKFITEELGIAKIFMHTPESGNAYKFFENWSSKPPESLYRDLPRKFCFQKTHSRPHFLSLDERLAQIDAHPYFKNKRKRKNHAIEREYALSALPMHVLNLE